MRRRHLRGALAIATMLALGAGCAPELPERAQPPRGSLGREMYTMVCDRVGAQALREDIAGESYHSVCHADAAGAFADKVDEAKLPPLDPSARDVKGNPVALEEQQENRAHNIARIEALARRRDDLIVAFDTAFSNETIGTKDLDNPDEKKSCDPAPGNVSEADVRTELAGMLGRLTDLYNDDTVPHLTRGLSRVMDDIEKSSDAQAALARFDARQGYRPTDVALGVARPILSYPRLVELANALLRILSADIDPTGALKPDEPRKKAKDRVAEDRTPGAAHGALVQLLAVAREELRTAKALPDLPPLVAAPDTADASLVRLSRPRGNLELTRAILLKEDPAFSIGTPRYVVARDLRGVAKVKLANGQVPAPFLDKAGPGGKPDGLPDLDDLGQFVTVGEGAPAPFKPFFELGKTASVTRDKDGRAAPYEYIDVSSTFLASLTKDLVPLLDADVAKQHETVMDLLAGFYLVAGEREPEPKSERDYGGTTLRYRAFRKDASPLLDLVHGIGQVLADPTTDDTLALLGKLAREKPELLARLIGVGLEIKEIGNKHPEATIPEDSTLWDEMLDVLVEIAQKPKLIEDIMRAFGDDATLDLTRSAIAYMKYRDELTYDRDNLNGRPFNLTTNKAETLKTLVDRTKPDTGNNRSAFQRFLQALHDINGMSTCTKQGAVAHLVWNGLPIDFPSFTASAACVVLGADAPPNPMPLCGMFRIKNIASELVDGVLGVVQLDIRDDCMRKMVSSPLTGIVGGADAFLEEVSGIKGFNTKPTIQGVNRMVFFDLPHDGLPGDTKNTKTRNFLRDLFEPTQTLVCPEYPFTDKDGAKLNLRQCATFADTLRGRDTNALFPLEELGFIEAAKPLARAFHDNDANLLFVDLFDVLHLHWGSKAQSPQECDPKAPKTNARWCSQDGASSYEPLIAEALATDLFPALHDATRELATITIPHCEARDARGVCTKSVPYDGVKVIAEAVKAMVDPAKNKGLVRRNGDASVTRNDGTKNPQVTPIYLLIDALKGFDKRFADEKAKDPNNDRLPQWRRARSQIVDQLFDIDGTGKTSKWKNVAVQKILPVLVDALRSQVAANCPDPTKGCTWGRKELPQKLENVVTGPSFAGALDVIDAIRSDEAARTELERLLVFLLQGAQAEASKTTLASLADILQIFEDDKNLTALLNATADATGPEVVGADGKVESRGLLLSIIEVIARVTGEVRDKDGTRLCGREIDPNRTLPVVLRKLVSPGPDGRPPPIEVLIDVVADVNRRAPESPRETKLDADDYKSITFEVSDFCSHPSRGLEQVYEVIKQATKDL